MAGVLADTNPSTRKFMDPEKQRAFQKREAFSKGQRPKPPKPQRWSHQNDLDALKGKQLDLCLIDNGDIITGELIEADQFTIKLRRNGRNAVIFKHAICFFGEAAA